MSQKHKDVMMGFAFGVVFVPFCILSGCADFTAGAISDGYHNVKDYVESGWEELTN